MHTPSPMLILSDTLFHCIATAPPFALPLYIPSPYCLDININGTDVFPVATRLRELNTPFVFASASDADRIGPEFREEQLIAKPYTIGQLQQSLSFLLAPSGA